MSTGPSEIAKRVVQALEAADDSVRGLPARVAGCVLLALGSRVAEHDDLARHLAALFRSGLLTALERAFTELSGNSRRDAAATSFPPPHAGVCASSEPSKRTPYGTRNGSQMDE